VLPLRRGNIQHRHGNSSVHLLSMLNRDLQLKLRNYRFRVHKLRSGNIQLSYRSLNLLALCCGNVQHQNRNFHVLLLCSWDLQHGLWDQHFHMLPLHYRNLQHRFRNCHSLHVLPVPHWGIQLGRASLCMHSLRRGNLQHRHRSFCMLQLHYRNLQHRDRHIHPKHMLTMSQRYLPWRLFMWILHCWNTYPRYRYRHPNMPSLLSRNLLFLCKFSDL